jgi:hypothetical protein
VNWLERLIVKKKAESLVDNAIKESRMSAQMKAWLIGFANCAISALAAGSAGLTMGVDWKHSLGIAGISAVVSIVKWVAQHPIPGGAQ